MQAPNKTRKLCLEPHNKHCKSQRQPKGKMTDPQSHREPAADTRKLTLRNSLALAGK